MLHGRGAECDQIDRLLADAEAGGVILVRGGPGTGKSTLLEYARERAEGLRVLQTSGIEVESELAYAGLHQLIWPILSRVDELQPVQAAALRAALGLELGQAPDRFLIAVALLTLLSEAADDQPLLLLIDDAQWLDRPTLDALGFVARRLAGEPIVMLLGSRTGFEPIEVPGVPHLELHGLAPEAAAALLEDAAPSPVDPQVASRLAEATGGNPLALTELAENLEADQLSGAAPLPDPVPVGERLEQPFLERFGRLPDTSQELLLVAAVADSPALGPILAAARTLGVDADALAPAERERLIRTGPGTLEFRHPLVRAAIYQAAERVDRDRAHLALADVLHDESDLGRRAWHRAAAALETDEDVAAELERAAHRAGRQGALSATASALRRAAQLTSDASGRGRRLAAAGRAAFLSGERSLAESQLEEAIPLLEHPVQRANAAVTLGELYTMASEPIRAVEVLTGGADEVLEGYPDLALDLLIPATVIIGECLCVDSRPILRRAEAARERGGDARAVEYIRSSSRLSTETLSEAGRLETYLPEELSGWGATRDFWAGATSSHPASSVDLPDAIAFLTALAGRLRSQGLAGQLCGVLVALAWGEIQAGRFPAAVADATEALELSRDSGQQLGVGLGLAELAVVAAVQGRQDDCRAFVAEAIPSPQAGARWSHHAIGFWAQGLAALGGEDPETAAFRLMDVRPGGPFEQHWVTPLAVPDLVEAAAWAGEIDVARDAAAQLETWAQRTGLRWAQAAAARCRGILATDADEATAGFEESLRLHEALDRPFQRARTRLLYGEMLRRERRRVEARTYLRLALQAFEHQGADPWAERARRELRATGQTLRRRETEGLDLLTPQEMQIARFVARGGTNKEVAAQLFLSPRTVASHLQSIFRKLGIATRTALAQLDLEQPDER